MKIAFVGLGKMGSHMAHHLLRAGHDLTVWNRTPSKADGHRSAGATVAPSPAHAAREAEIVITMLADDSAVTTAVLNPGGIIEALPKGAVHIGMSTISVALSKKLAEEHSRRGQRYMAAPVFGRPDAAEAKKLFIAAAGEPSVIDYCMPVLEALGQKVFILGDKPEMANVVKVSGNFLITCVVESLAEAIALARKYGIDPHDFVQFLTNSLFSAPVYKTYGSIIADERYQPAGFKMRLGLKDNRLALAAAEAVDTPLPFANIVHDNLLTAIARGMEEMDWSATAKLAAENAGLK
jgi:3-hydroxyisobutyrate dehydrogenase-like beta-hydroxyacid dehydrogenase